VYLCSFVSVCVFSVLFLLFPSCSPLISSCLLFFLQSFMIKRNRNYEAPPLCLSDEDNLEPVTIMIKLDFACRKGSTVWWKVRWERLLIGSFFPLADPGLWMKWQRHHRCCFMLYQGIFSFSLILRALFLFTRPGFGCFHWDTGIWRRFWTLSDSPSRCTHEQVTRWRFPVDYLGNIS